MELRHLRYFVAVADALHFGRAAAQLGISQPPLSQQVRALEDELGVVLLDRSSRRVQLTEAGRLFLGEARRTLEQAQHAIDVTRRFQSGELGELSIGFATSTPFVSLMSRALADFRQAHPNIHLSLAELGRDAQIAQLLERRIDLGCMRSFEPLVLPPGLVALELLQEPLMVALREDHPLAQRGGTLRIDDIGGMAFVVYHQAMGAGFNDHLGPLFRRRGHEFRVTQEVSGLVSLLGLVAAGWGISLLVRSLAALHVDGVVYRALDEPGAMSRLSLVHRDQLSPAAAQFVATLRGNDGDLAV